MTTTTGADLNEREHTGDDHAHASEAHGGDEHAEDTQARSST
jgi:hypothetical protein